MAVEQKSHVTETDEYDLMNLHELHWQCLYLSDPNQMFYFRNVSNFNENNVKVSL